MGLRLRKHSFSFPSQVVPGLAPRSASESETDIYSTSEPSSHHNLNQPPIRTTRPPNRAGQQDNGRQRKRRRHHHRLQLERTSGGTHHVRPRQRWTADAVVEGCALARSSLQLPSDNSTTNNFSSSERHWSRCSSRRRSTTLSPRRGRPPSLERQDAFRDERTAKSRHSHGFDNDDLISSLYLSQSERAEHQSREEDEEAKEVAELYRMGLLYDNEYERGAGFSLDRIARDYVEEPVYSVRVRPAKRIRREEERMGSGFVSLSSVDLAFSALAEDEALAGWLMSGCHREEAAADALRTAAAASVVRDTVHKPPRLIVIYELADDAVSAMSAEDSFCSASVSELSYCVGEDDASAWTMIDGCNGTNENAALVVSAPGAVEEAVAEKGGVEPWVVLGLDGS
ncbi:hypothetical protein C8A03DRAFT_46290 [Achaetomium macrosporum]|uniref:Uncharacterized protein n=1 Tax=Achaetomium macrosporum TaxID=79813 RepID=A0AAN7H589_9PEZI|nr:hypothetical protein C8A03DRAFT_46290 [Achaetomium macrosporum]